MKYTLQEMQIKVLEELQEKHDNLMKYWNEDKSNESFIYSMSDILKTYENMNDLFNEMIWEENNPIEDEEETIKREIEERIDKEETMNDIEMQREMDR